MFRNDLIRQALNGDRRVDQLLQDKRNKALAEYILRDYVMPDQIPDIKLNGVEQKTPANMFFEQHRYLSCFDEASTLEHFTEESVQEWWSEKLCPYRYSAHFFDTFIALEAIDSAKSKCFLVLSPDANAPTKVMSGMAQSLAITHLFSALSDNPPAQIGFHYKVNEILEYFRTGLGKKKRFGIF